MGARKNGRARGRHARGNRVRVETIFGGLLCRRPSPLACLLLARAFFLAPISFPAPATQAISCVNYNNVYGPRFTTQYLMQMKENSKLNNSGFNEWLEILAGEDLQTKLRKSENFDFKFSASNGTGKASAVS